MERIPPHNLEAEESILGSLLIDKNAMIKVADSLRTDDFYRSQHADIYRAMLDLYGRQEPIDLLTLANKLEEQGKLE
jgi:replicative DNA helicase